jgi:hypothetical protein
LFHIVPFSTPGNLVGSGKLFVGLCGFLSVTGSSNIGTAEIVLDMKGKSGIVDNTYWTPGLPLMYALLLGCCFGFGVAVFFFLFFLFPIVNLSAFTA